MSEKRYSPSHEWVTIDGEEATIGITDFAQSSLGTIVFLDLPNPGKQFKENDIFGVVESVKSASDLYIPMSGTILAINENVVQNPERINDDAEGNWLIKLTLSNPEEFAKLLSKEAYDSLEK
jgi:glycine cleavage system H protein